MHQGNREDAGAGDVLPGFSRTDCRDLDRDALRAAADWRGRALADAGPRRFQLRFWLYGGAKLHAFAFE